MGKDRDPGDLQQQHSEHPQTQEPKPSSRPMSPENQRQQSRDPKLQAARVRLPDGQFKEFELNRGSEGEFLFRQVTSDLSIEEREYFSLCFYDKDKGERHWLYNDKKILRQLKGLPWEFSFEVKFYPTTPTTLVDDHARYFLFLQLRRDILTERLPATAATHALLGSFVAQIEFDDAPSQITEEYEKFIVQARLVPDKFASPEIYKQIAELHRELRGRTTSEAENLYLDHCKQLALYGVHLFVAKDEKNKPVNIGIGAAGINVYKEDERVLSFGWQNINKISYRRNGFYVKLKPGEHNKNEVTVGYKLQDYPHAKRVWKCAVEHHTFFRLIQPESKTSKGLLNFGSGRFRYQGRTQFQTKMASQMFDRPTNVERSPSAMSQPVESGRQVLTPLHYTDTELEQKSLEKFRRTLTPKSYTQDDEIPTETFAKYSQHQKNLNVSTILTRTSNSQNVDESLAYSPRDYDSPESSAAYYLSERSSLRTPSSAYYPTSEQTPFSSGMQSPSEGHQEKSVGGEYSVHMRSKKTGGARRNLFGRSSEVSNDTVRLVSFHEPVDPTVSIPQTHRQNELPEIPIERIVHVYHEGHYNRISPRRNERPELPRGYGNYMPRNGVTHVDRLEPNNEMDQQPIRFFVDVRHSGSSRRDQTKRISHAGKEDVKEVINPKDYEFEASTSEEPLERIELAQEVSPANIRQYTRIYHDGCSKTSEPSTSSTPQYRLITHVHPLVVSNKRDGRNRQSSSNVNATINRREHVVSTTVRRESPDTERRLRLSASVDRSGNVTDTTESNTNEKSKNLKNVTESPINETSRASELDQSPIADFATVYHHGKSWIKDQPASPAKKIAEPVEPETQEVRLVARVQPEVQDETAVVAEKPKKSKKSKDPLKFGFFSKTKKTEVSYPSTSEQYSGPVTSTDRHQDLENIPLEHQFTIPAYSPQKLQETETERKSETEEHKPKYRLFARFRHEGDEDVVEKPEAYGLSSDAYDGPLDETSRASELDQSPIADYATVYHHGKSWIKEEKTEDQKEEPKFVDPTLANAHVRLIARVLPFKKDKDSVVKSEHKARRDSKRFSKFWKSSTPSDPQTSSEEFTGELDTVLRSQELEHRNIAKDVGQSTSSSNRQSTLIIENSVRYFPSSLQYEPSIARIEGYTEDGQGYNEVRIHRRAEVQLEPVYILREANTARSHAYLSTATAYFSGASQPALTVVSEGESGITFSSIPPMSPPERSFLAKLGFKRDKKKDKKKNKGKKENDSSETSESEIDEKREFAVVEFQPESGQPHTTVSTWQETNDLPEQVEVYTDENGRQITRTIKSSQVKHTVQTQSFQNYIVDGDQVPVGVVNVERSREQLTPLGQQGASNNGNGFAETQTRTMTYEAQGENSAPPDWAEQGLGEYVSSKSVTQGNRTIETITYKTEKDGIIETHVEHRVTIHSDNDIDHDAELSQAIMEATQMNPDMVVEKIEVRQETTQ